jgi:beta-glucosidase
LPGETTEVSFTVTPRQMALIDNDGGCILEPGRFNVYVSGCQPDRRSLELTGNKTARGSFELAGNRLELEY